MSESLNWDFTIDGIPVGDGYMVEVDDDRDDYAVYHAWGRAPITLSNERIRAWLCFHDRCGGSHRLRELQPGTIVRRRDGDTTVEITVG